MSHLVSITCTCHKADTPGLSARNCDVSEKASCYEVSSSLKPGFDLFDSSFSRKGHHVLSQKCYSWSSSYCRSDENVDIPIYPHWWLLTFPHLQMENMGWVPQRSTGLCHNPRAL